MPPKPEAGVFVKASVTVSTAAPAQEIWDLVADVRNTGRFSPETFEAEWLDGATGPALGAKCRGHVKRNEILFATLFGGSSVVSFVCDATSTTCARRWSGSRPS
ncbi:MAG: hypothetical protein QOK02_1134 [Mycobacterium sp.]|jgi:hypothetical protein|nr:hypothetical protein [Mycobacterium sp.]